MRSYSPLLTFQIIFSAPRVYKQTKTTYETPVSMYTHEVYKWETILFTFFDLKIAMSICAHKFYLWEIILTTFLVTKIATQGHMGIYTQTYEK